MISSRHPYWKIGTLTLIDRLIANQGKEHLFEYVKTLRDELASRDEVNAVTRAELGIPLHSPSPDG